ncbi:hypothetical protein E8D34_02815 [Nocardioides sp. GY 10113]|uniref:hypothetical protein n=1 Tax=Nocardioides sp. GY 10113 TaxID=2569761 RepID=UPI0010A89EF1|nr:hypothetical protein [Nocardioides sp. GY 10113]TIC88628.1 hypothetical protein E8D34_02815 [Nocardioides sp. GY 10113]
METGPETRAEGTVERPARRRGAVLAATRAAVGLLAVALILGVVAGRLWWAWWSPAMPGRVYDTVDGLAWYPDPLDPGFAHVFSGTAQFVVIGFAAGLLLGLLGGLVTRQRAIFGLVAVVVGSLLGLVITYRTGIAASPADPATLLGDAAAGDQLPGHLQVSGWTPYLAWPVGALFGFLVVMVSTMSSDRAAHRRAVDGGAVGDETGGASGSAADVEAEAPIETPAGEPGEPGEPGESGVSPDRSEPSPHP